METGITGYFDFLVDETKTAQYCGSGKLPVLGTPFLIAGIEHAAMESVEPFLEQECGTVGTLMNVTHEAASPIGMKIQCFSKLINIDGRKLTFQVEAYDECGRIGQGTHERFIIKNDRFLEKTNNKMK